MLLQQIIFGIVSVQCAGLLSFSLTPIVRVLAYKIGAIDVPRDDRRMHQIPIPRIGGLAIFISFFLTTLVSCEISGTLISIWAGGALLVFIGILDDKKSLNPWIKLIFQLLAAGIAVFENIKIEHINLFGTQIDFGFMSIPITIIWIVGMTNAINLIDGLDGLACGVSAICSVSLFTIALLFAEPQFAILTGIIAGCCIGFLPFNTNPAKIFLGDSGALFLGYAFSILSISGVFKLHTMLAFMIPFIVFGLPLLDTILAFFRRIFHGKNPFSGDRKHIHHRLVDMGFGHKQSVRILYAICGILGISAIMFTDRNLFRAGIIVIAALVIFIVLFLLLKNPATRPLTGLGNFDTKEEKADPDPKDVPGGTDEKKEENGKEKMKSEEKK
ncbi:MAG: undecaprenyl/decaprenyl-phosphate alpha-N-acetylglucosaminyl 1-phosphate transferase [Clostridia bacterium]|nr:undecaprenyl/decaprenyl-phosphate alpha-N-acetylglucosaminyl 1-phosphate transferase [Clostridia bacterium]